MDVRFNNGMDEIDEVRNVENECRLCHSSKEPRSSIFADGASEVSLRTKIKDFLSIEILVSDKLSSFICGSCVTKINKWQDYKETCLRSQEEQQRCLVEPTEIIPLIGYIKTESMDFYDEPLPSNDDLRSMRDDRSDSTDVEVDVETLIWPNSPLIKQEAPEVEEPTTMTTSKDDDQSAEAVSTQVLVNPKSLRATRKKRALRGPSTHYRGIRKYRKRCTICQICVRSKQAYNKHMGRFHSGKKPVSQTKPAKKANNNVAGEETIFSVLNHLSKHSDKQHENNVDRANRIPVPFMNGDPSYNNPCEFCGMIYKHKPNLTKHMEVCKNLSDDERVVYRCVHCGATFLAMSKFLSHLKANHKRRDIVCSHCRLTFKKPEAYVEHSRQHHPRDSRLPVSPIGPEDPLACFICGKKFTSEKSLQVHRGHHSRVTNKLLSMGKPPGTDGTNPVENDDNPITVLPSLSPLPNLIPIRSLRAREIVPNGSAAKQLRVLQCQVCDNRFDDVADLRKHLWDVHCARTKSEKDFASAKLQCELCTSVLPDEESFRSHVKWHENHPILSNKATKTEMPAKCLECGKSYSTMTSLKRHKKNHHVENCVIQTNLRKNPRNRRWSDNGFACDICRKVFATNATLNKHRSAGHPEAEPRRPRRPSEVINPVRRETSEDRAKKQSVTCNLCRKIMRSSDELSSHRVRFHRIMKTVVELFGGEPSVSLPSPVVRTAKKSIPRTVEAQYRCRVKSCNLKFKSFIGKRNHERIHDKAKFNKEHKKNNSTGNRKHGKPSSKKDERGPFRL